MKLTFILIVSAFLNVSAASYAQNISLTVKDAPLKRVFKELRKQSGYNFLYGADVIAKTDRVSFSVHNTPFSEVLEKCFAGQPVTYVIDKNTVVIKLKPALSYLNVGEKVQEIAVTGSVTDDKGLPLPGVTVKLKETSLGAITDNQGKYTIKLPADEGILVFSFIGYTSQEIAIKGRTIINVTLVPESSKLSEIIVVGYGTQKKSDVTGAIAVIKGTETINEPARDVASLVQARAAGVEVVTNSGDPAGSSSIYIRGASSLNNPGPLYVVDGVPQGNTGNNFNTQDIESIEVLKDASASSIYGAAAAGGVILVTTKRGEKNKKTVLSFNAYGGVTVPILRDLLNRDQYIQAKQDIGQDILTAGQNGSSLPNTNWVNELYQHGHLQNYDLSVSGGNDKSNYYMSGNLSDQTGNVIENAFKRYSFRINSDHKVGKLLQIGESIQIWNSFNRPTVTGGGFPYRSRPDEAVYDPTNVSGGGWGKDPAGFAGGNTVGYERSYQFHNESSAVEGNAYATLHLFEGLDLKGVFGYVNQSDFNTQYIAPYNFGSVQNTDPTLNKSTNNNKSLSTTITLNYNRTFKKHSIQALAGYEQRLYDGSNLNGQADSLATPNTKNFFVTNNTNQFVTGGLFETLIKSYFGRVSYNFDQKYILEASVRRDGDFYRFGPNNQYGTFPSASAAWRISQESFVKEKLPFVSDLKLRASYGTVGNNNIPTYLFLSTYGQTGGYSFANDGSKSLAYGVNGLANQAIKWETTRETNIGLDLAVLNNALTFSADYYNRLTDGILYSLNLPTSAGMSTSFITNIGKIQNKGLELMATYKNSAGAFRYSISANASFNQNKILQLDGTANNPVYAGGNSLSGGYGITANQNLSRSAVGHSLGQFYGLEATGIYQTAAAAASGPTINGVKPMIGDLIYKDLNRDGAIDGADQTYIGNPNPKMIYGFNLNLRYKWFDVAALFQGVAGVDLYNGRQPYNQYLFGDGNTTSDVFKTSFFGNNGLTNQPRVVVKDNAGNYALDPYGNYSQASSWWIESGSYLKLQNLQLGFSLPSQWLSKIKVSSARIFVMGSNLFTATKYTGLDPQVQAYDVKSRGIDSPTNYPQNRFYSVGINTTF